MVVSIVLTVVCGISFNPAAGVTCDTEIKASFSAGLAVTCDHFEISAWVKIFGVFWGWYTT
jgi:hypothetical protein